MGKECREESPLYIHISTLQRLCGLMVHDRHSVVLRWCGMRLHLRRLCTLVLRLCGLMAATLSSDARVMRVSRCHASACQLRWSRRLVRLRASCLVQASCASVCQLRWSRPSCASACQLRWSRRLMRLRASCAGPGVLCVCVPAALVQAVLCVCVPAALVQAVLCVCVPAALVQASYASACQLRWSRRLP